MALCVTLLVPATSHGAQDGEPKICKQLRERILVDTYLASLTETIFGGMVIGDPDSEPPTALSHLADSLDGEEFGPTYHPEVRAAILGYIRTATPLYEAFLKAMADHARAGETYIDPATSDSEKAKAYAQFMESGERIRQIRLEAFRPIEEARERLDATLRQAHPTPDAAGCGVRVPDVVPLPSPVPSPAPRPIATPPPQPSRRGVWAGTIKVTMTLDAPDPDLLYVAEIGYTFGPGVPSRRTVTLTNSWPWGDGTISCSGSLSDALSPTVNGPWTPVLDSFSQQVLNTTDPYGINLDPIWVPANCSLQSSLGSEVFEGEGRVWPQTVTFSAPRDARALKDTKTVLTEVPGMWDSGALVVRQTVTWDLTFHEL